MELIDDEGRLFGFVNVVDALVVLIVLAVAVAGIALINPFDSQETDTRYATIDLGEQQPYVAELISEGDSVSPQGSNQNLTVTDVYVTGGPDGSSNASVVVRVRTKGTLVESQQQAEKVFRYQGTQVQRGNTLTIDTQDYTVSGTITDVGDSGTDLPTAERSVVFTSTVSADVAQTVGTGDTYRVNGATVARITDTYVGPSPDSGNRTLALAATVQTLNRTGGPSFAGTPLTLGRSIQFSTDQYTLSGNVQRIGTASLNPQTTPALVETTVPVRVANQISAGDEYVINESAIASITRVEVYPTSDTAQKRVVLGIQVETIRQNGQQTFGQTPMRLGASIPFETDEYSLSGTIIQRGSLDRPGATDEVQVEVKLANVPPEVAQNVLVGMTERTGDETTARVVDKRVEPAEVILTSDDGNIYQREHPRNKDVYLTVRVQIRRTETGIQFRGQRVQPGGSVTFDFQRISVSGTIVDIDEAE